MKSIATLYKSGLPFIRLHCFKHWRNPKIRETLAQRLLMQGNFNLKDQIDSSHTFLYGHRYWPQVKAAVQKYASYIWRNEQTLLSDQIISVAKGVASDLKVDQSLLVGITAVAFMTAQQAGLARVQYSGQSPHR